MQTTPKTSRAAANVGFNISRSTQTDQSETFSLAESVQTSRGTASADNSVGFGTTNIHLHGKTEANYDFGTGSVIKQSASHATDCEGCEDDSCINWSGVFQLTFKTNPTIQLPGPSEYAHLSPCQQEKVKAWIQNVLLPHELEHKAAFQTYDGVVNKPFSFKICKDKMGAELLQPIHDAEELKRRNAANKKSDALDPFHSNIDLECEDEKTNTVNNANVP